MQPVLCMPADCGSASAASALASSVAAEQAHRLLKAVALPWFYFYFKISMLQGQQPFAIASNPSTRRIALIALSFPFPCPHQTMVLALLLHCTVVQYGDLEGLATGRTKGASLYGADQQELNSVLLGKAAHYFLLLSLPIALHGPAAAFAGAAAYTLTQSIVLASTFAVSHNVPESKPLDAGPTQVCRCAHPAAHA